MDLLDLQDIFCRGDANRAATDQSNVDSLSEAWRAMSAGDGSSSRAVCAVSGCGVTCVSVARLDAHYALRHDHQCNLCGSSFATSSWLRLHADEEHSSLFAELAARENAYVCLVDGCAARFNKPHARRQHLVDTHFFPSSFRFGREDSSAPCRYYHTRGGCRLGSSCLFQHEGVTRTTAADDAEADELGNLVQQLVVGTTDSISFGRKASRMQRS